MGPSLLSNEMADKALPLLLSAQSEFAQLNGANSLSATPMKRSAHGFPTLSSKPQAKKPPIWSKEKDARAIQLCKERTTLESISKTLPGQTDLFFPSDYEDCLAMWWTDERKDKLARMYERCKSDMWGEVAKEMGAPIRSVEAMHWLMGEYDIARRAGVTPSTLTNPNHDPVFGFSNGPLTLQPRGNPGSPLGGDNLPSLAEFTAGLPGYPHQYSAPGYPYPDRTSRLATTPRPEDDELSSGSQTGLSTETSVSSMTGYKNQPVPQIETFVLNDVTFVKIPESNLELYNAFIDRQQARRRTTDLTKLPISDALFTVSVPGPLATTPGMAFAKEIIRFGVSEAIVRLFRLLYTQQTPTRLKIELCHLMLGMLTGKPCTHRSGDGILTGTTSRQSKIYARIIEPAGTTESDIIFFDGARKMVNECGLFFSAANVRSSLAGAFTDALYPLYCCTSLVETPWETQEKLSDCANGSDNIGEVESMAQ